MKKKVKIFGLVGLLILVGLFGLRLIVNKKTTTPEDYVNLSSVNRQTYLNDKLQVIKTVDSLLSIEVIYKPAEKTRRYFDGEFFDDTVDRKWAIDLPMKGIKYVEHYVDTIFYKPTDKNVFAGILISKTKNRLATNGIEYFGNGFLCKRKGKTIELIINGYSVTGNETMDQCREVLHEIYFRKMGLVDSSFNLNDKRYWTSKNITKVVWD